MKKISYLILALSTLCLTNCGSSVKTLGRLLKIKASDVINIEIERNHENYEVDLEKKDIFLESFLKVKVDTSKQCKCMGPTYVTLYTENDTYEINEFHTDTNSGSYHYELTKDSGFSSIVNRYINNAL